MAPNARDHFRLAEGFPGERLTLLPQKTVSDLRRHPIACQLYPTRIGFFPAAVGHFMERPSGIDDFVVLLVLKGAGRLQLDGQRAELRSLDCTWLPPGQPHRYEADAQQAWTLAWAHLRGEQAEAYLRQIGPPGTALALGQSELARDRFETLYAAVRAEAHPAQPLCLHAALANWLAGLARNRCSQEPATNTGTRRLQTLRRFLRENLHRRINLAEMAAVAGCTPNHLSALFRREIQDSPASYFLHLKMARACELLRGTDLSVAEIADALGFDDAFYFSRCFRRCYHTSPSRYRKAQ